MTNKKNKKLALEDFWDEFDTRKVLDAVDGLDNVRGVLGDDEDGRPPEVRQDLLKLHKMAMSMRETQSSDPEEMEQLLNLATDIEMTVSECIEDLTRITDVVSRLLDLEDLG